MAGCPSTALLRLGMPTLCRRCWQASLVLVCERVCTRFCVPVQGASWGVCAPEVCSNMVSAAGLLLLLPPPRDTSCVPQHLPCPPTSPPAAGSDAEEPAADGDSPLHKAAIGGHVAVVRLLKGRTHLEQRNASGSTSLYNASSQGHLEVIRELVEEGAAGETDKTARR